MAKADRTSRKAQSGTTRVAEPEQESTSQPVTEASAAPIAENGASVIEGENSAPAPAEAPATPRAWYVVHSYSGYENKVKKNLEHRIESMAEAGGNKIYQVVVPTEEEIELKDGQRRVIERRMYPGYILVEMEMDDDSWYVVRNTPGVTGFVGMGNKPTPLRPDEVDKIMKRIESEEPKLKVNFKPGQKVRILSGPFSDFMGTIDDMNPEKGKAKIMVSFFNRETPVEVDLLQIEKV